MGKTTVGKTTRGKISFTGGTGKELNGSSFKK